ncbi:MAG: serine/threonine-protein phosphatase [Bacteroidales bacterium]|jgi:sigma-B regulation protein RsbU (phosphoserine phosphatase)|nr:serine/threonine-protein phosphatase [Bacteroidales bacterium]MCU0408113.1 serine/threonine-protein phosphatase [Bacteroidales bacterium]
MENGRIPSNRLEVSKFKLKSLLEITNSINDNLPEEDLLSRYESILRNNLGIGKILIFKHSRSWEVILNCGFPPETENIDIDSRLIPMSEVVCVTPDDGFEGVDIIIPVRNNDVPLAFVLIGDIEEEGVGMSPVLKHYDFLQTISSIIIVAIENKRLHAANLRQAAMKKELELAARMQKMLIPDHSRLPGDGNLRVYGFYCPHHEVGGDYYDLIPLSRSKTGICIADVSGKGISAAMLMSNFQASLRALFTHDIFLEALIRKLNTIVASNASGEKFITFFVARYDIETGLLEYINAAHNPPILYNTVSGELNYLGPSCVGIGMLDEIPEIRRAELTVSQTSKLVCYTDGLSELRDENGNEAGTRDIVRFISNDRPVAENIEALMRELGLPDNNPSVFDDVSIIAADMIR